MRFDPNVLLEPVFRFLENAIHEYGDDLYLGLVYVSLPVLVWILSGGLRRRFRRRTPGLNQLICERCRVLTWGTKTGTGRISPGSSGRPIMTSSRSCRLVRLCSVGGYSAA